MKHLWLLFILLPLFASAQEVNTYKAESQGYFSTPKFTETGIILTTNHASELLLLKQGKLKSIVTAPGCGKYFKISPNKKKVGFKLIKKDGSQVPAILNLKDQTVKKLHKPVNLCGQVSFSEDGKVSYTINNQLLVRSQKNVKKYNLGEYSNIAPLSPNGKFVVFNNNKDQLILLNLKTGTQQSITKSQHTGMKPVWSHDSKKIAYSSLSGDIFVYHIPTKQNYKIGYGESPAWGNQSEQVYFTKLERKNMKFYNSDIAKAHFTGKKKRMITNTKDSFEREAAINKNGEIVYHLYTDRKIIKAETSAKGIKNKKVLYSEDSNEKIQDNSYQIKKQSKGTKKVPGTVPYVNQVWDTPYKGTDYNYSACAPSTAAMALGYYEKVSKWPTYRHNGIQRNYAAYVGNQYTAYGYTYYHSSSGAKGGYGYMWGTGGSPNSKMKDYIKKHDLSSTQDWSVSYQQTLNQIDQGYPYPHCNFLTSSGHLTLAIGYLENQHTIIYHDPYGDKNNGTYPNYYGKNSYYDWPGYNNGYRNLNGIAWAVTAEGAIAPDNTPELEYPSDNASNIEMPVSFNWSSPVGANAFRIQVSKNNEGWSKNDGFTSSSEPNSTVIVNASISEDTYTWSKGEAGSYEGPEQNTTYYWTVRSWDEETGTSEYTPVQSFTTKEIKFERVWSRAELTNDIPDWFSSSESTERGLAYNDNKVYVVSRKEEPTIKILNYSDGQDKNELNTNGVYGGTYALNDVETSWDKQVLACNLTVDASSQSFKVYKWTDIQDAPDTYLSYSSRSLRLGDNFTVLGNLSKDAVIYVPAANSDKVLRWVVADGNLNHSPEIITLQGISNLGTAPSVAPFGISPEEDFYVNSNGISPVQYNSDGTKAGEISGGVIANYSNAVKMMIDGAKRYLITFQSNPDAGDPNGQNFRVVDVTDGASNVSADDVYGVSERIGDNSNTNCTGDIAFRRTTNPEDIIIYILSTNNGVAAYRPLNMISEKTRKVASPVAEIEKPVEHMSVYPNPADEKLGISIRTAKAKTCNLSVIDLSGKQVMQRKQQITPGNSKINLDVSGLKPGTYILKLQNGGRMINKKFIIQH